MSYHKSRTTTNVDKKPLPCASCYKLTYGNYCQECY